MSDDSQSLPITALLERWRDGDSQALEELVPLVVADLRRMAARRLAGEQRHHSLEPTELVNETYLRLVRQRRVHWKSRVHFLAVAATLMRRILIDHARARKAGKRAGRPITLESAVGFGAAPQGGVDALDLDDALRRLERFAPRQARIVELRFFSGHSVEEVASVLGLSEATVKADWALARAWLHRELRSSGDRSPCA